MILNSICFWGKKKKPTRILFSNAQLVTPADGAAATVTSAERLVPHKRPIVRQFTTRALEISIQEQKLCSDKFCCHWVSFFPSRVPPNANMTLQNPTSLLLCFPFQSDHVAIYNCSEFRLKENLSILLLANSFNVSNPFIQGIFHARVCARPYSRPHGSHSEDSILTFRILTL